MLQRPVYRGSIVVLTLASLAGAVAVFLVPPAGPGVEITLPTVTPPAAAAPVEAPGASTLVDINTASAPELADALPDIGETLSARIVAYREANGRFVRTDQLMAVRGIGPATYSAIRDLVSVGE